jgi:hypothetical protein
MSTMVRTQVYLPQDIYDRLQYRCEAEGITMAEQIREALQAYLVKTIESSSILRADDPLWSLVGAGEGPEDASVNHDKYIYGWDQALA